MAIANQQSFFSAFPRLSRDIKETSPETTQYNCIAWVLGMTDRNVWPNMRFWHWPLDYPNEETVSAFEALFEFFGYKRCQSSKREQGYEKIALYTLNGCPTHATRQLSSGRWTSKCGQSVDIEHKLKDLEGPKYGRVEVCFRRPRRANA